jgi:hypothetical protein
MIAFTVAYDSGYWNHIQIRMSFQHHSSSRGIPAENVLNAASPIELMKACKNEAEINGNYCLAVINLALSL